MLTSIKNTSQQKWWILFAMGLSLGMTFVDQTAVGIALPTMQRVFNLSPTSTQWIMNSYLLTLAVFLSIGGRLGDTFQHHRVFDFGLAIFLVTSIACAVTSDYMWLIISRSLQGIGAALMLSNTGVIIFHVFPDKERGKAMGLYLGGALLFLPLALIIGGMFTQYLSWRLIFWINLPLSLICFCITFTTRKLLDELPKKEKLDLPGLITLILAISSLVIALMQGSSIGWTSLPILLLGCSFIIFLLLNIYLEEHTTNPLIDFNIFKNKIFLCASILFFSMSIFAVLFVFDAMFYQDVLGYQPALAGILFFPNIICTIVAAPFAGILFDKYSYKLPVLIGLVLTMLGLFLKAIVASQQSYWYLLPGIILMNIGAPLVLSPINTAALTFIEVGQRGLVSGTLQSIRQISNSVTFAILTAIIVASNHYYFTKFLNNSHVSNMDFSSEKINGLIIKAAYASAYAAVNYLSACIVLGALIFTVLLFRKIK